MKRKLCSRCLLIFLLFFDCFFAFAETDKFSNQIREHRTDVRKYYLLGDNMSPDELKKMRKSDAITIYCKSRGALAGLVKTGLTHSIGSSAFMKQVMESFRAIKDSGDHWDIIIADRAEGFFYRMLVSFKNNELKGMNADFVIPRHFDHSAIEKQLKRVLGDFNLQLGEGEADSPLSSLLNLQEVK